MYFLSNMVANHMAGIAAISRRKGCRRAECDVNMHAADLAQLEGL